MFEIKIRFQNDALRVKLEEHFGTQNLSGAIKRVLRDVVASKRVQKHHNQSKQAWEQQIQDEIEVIQHQVAGDFDDDAGGTP